MSQMIGMRVWLEAVEDKSLPSLVADTQTQWRGVRGYLLDFTGESASCSHPRRISELRKYQIRGDARTEDWDPLHSRVRDGYWFSSFFKSLQCTSTMWLSSRAFLNSGLVITS